MRKNEYKSLDSFIYEYSDGKAFSWQDPNGIERFMGLEFCYKGHYYRLCREPLDCVPETESGRFHVMEMMMKKEEYPSCDYYEDIGWYDSLQSVLDNCFLQDTPFKTVIMADDTEILSKD